jgi:hypothetical protein
LLVLRAAPKQRVIVADPAAARRERHGAYFLARIAVGLGVAAFAAGIVVRLLGVE